MSYRQPPGGRSQISFGGYEPSTNVNSSSRQPPGGRSQISLGYDSYSQGQNRNSTSVSQPPGGRSSIQFGSYETSGSMTGAFSYGNSGRSSFNNGGGGGGEYHRSTAVSQPPGGRTSIQLGSSTIDTSFQRPRIGYMGEEGGRSSSTVVSQPPGGRSSVQFGCDVPQISTVHGMSSYGRSSIYDSRDTYGKSPRNNYSYGNEASSQNNQAMSYRAEPQFTAPTSIPAPSSFRREEQTLQTSQMLPSKGGDYGQYSSGGGFQQTQHMSYQNQQSAGGEREPGYGFSGASYYYQ